MPSHPLGKGSIELYKYYDSKLCEYHDVNFDNIYFSKLEVYDSTTRRLVDVDQTTPGYSDCSIDLQTIKELQDPFEFVLKTNTTVAMRLEVWYYNFDVGQFSKAYTLNQVIPFDTITASSEWGFNSFTVDENELNYGLDFGIKISCDDHFKGLGCNYCEDHYYTSTCDKYCNPVPGNFTCDHASGEIVCAGHQTGERCEVCAEHYYPAEDCSVYCVEVQDKYTCAAEDGGKVCSHNWGGVECDTCAAGYFGMDCGVFCTPTEHYYCNYTGEKVCRDNTRRPENSCVDSESSEVRGLAVGATVVAVIALCLELVLFDMFRRFRKQTRENVQQPKTTTTTTTENDRETFKVRTTLNNLTKSGQQNTQQKEVDDINAMVTLYPSKTEADVEMAIPDIH